MSNSINGKSLESWIWDAACSIRGAKDAPKYKDYILPLVFTKRLCDVFDDEVDRIAREVGSREKAFKLVRHDKKLVRFYLPLQPDNPEEPVWSIIRRLSDQIGQQLGLPPFIVPPSELDFLSFPMPWSERYSGRVPWLPGPAAYTPGSCAA